MRVITLKSARAQAQGVLPYEREGRGISRDLLFFFPNVTNRPAVSGRGLQSYIHVYFLDRHFRLIFWTTLYPEQTVRLPEGTQHVVEALPEAGVLTEFGFLRGHL